MPLRPLRALCFSLIIGIRMNGSAHAGVIRFRFVRSAMLIKSADFGGTILPRWGQGF